MNLNRQPNIDDLFLAALELSPDRRAQFFDQQCSGFDPAIRREVELLLDGYYAAEAANLTQSPLDLSDYLAAALHASPDESNEQNPPHDVIADRVQIGGYRLRCKLGEGGMGTVYLADQVHPVRRQVALKIIKPGMDSQQVIARFEAERQALALMDHPNIARVFDASTTPGGHPYFVMELVEGPAITAYCDAQKLPIRRRLELFIHVCQAVQHAHQKGIIHRDLKPSNVLVATYDSQPAPKVIDFGIAKATAQSLSEETLYTQTGQLIGTPEYMSPEQTQADTGIDTRSDIYSLGVLLYELLTGSTPLDDKRLRSAGFEKVVRLIREEEAQRPSTRIQSIGDAAEIASNRCVQVRQLSALLRGDLDWIVLCALDKDRDRRYETADAFAADVRRYLNDEPIVARPPSAGYRAVKTFKRNHKLFIAVGVVFLLLIAGILATSVQWARSNGLAKRLQESAYVADMKLANQAYQVGDMTRVAELLDQNVPQPGDRNLRRFEWNYLARLSREVQRAHFQKGRGGIDRLAFLDRDGEPQLAVVQNQELKIYSSPLPNEVGFTLRSSVDPVQRLTAQYSNRWYWTPSVAISSNGHCFVTVTNVAPDPGPSKMNLTLRDCSTGGTLDSIDMSSILGKVANKSESDQAVSSIALSTDGRRLVTGHWDGTLTAWTINTDGILENVLASRIHHGPVVSLAFDAKGGLVASASWDRKVRLTDLSSAILASDSSQPDSVDRTYPLTPEQAFVAFINHETGVNNVAVSADGQRVFSISQRGRLYITDRTTKEQQIIEEGVMIFGLSVSPDGRLVAVGGEDGMIRIRDAMTGALIARLRGHAGGVRVLAFSFDGRILASGCDLGQVCNWSINDQLPLRSDAFAKCPGVLPAQRMLDVANTNVYDLEFHPTRPLLAISAENRVLFWDLVKEKFEKPIERAGRIRSVSFSADGQKVVIGNWGDSSQHNTQNFDLATRNESESGMASFDANVAKFGGNGRYLILSSDHPGATKVADISVYDTQANEICLELKSSDEYRFGYGADRFALSPDNRILAIFVHKGTGGVPNAMIFAWDLSSKTWLWKRRAHDSPIHSLEFSPDGKLLASTSDDHTIKLWEPNRGNYIRTLKGHRSWVMESDFLPDGKILATASIDGTVRLWDVANGEERFELRGDGSPLECIDVSPDGNTIAAGDFHGRIWLWHAGTGTQDHQLPSSSRLGMLVEQ